MMHDGTSFNPVTGKIGGGPCDAVEDVVIAELAWYDARRNVFQSRHWQDWWRSLRCC